jgi:hypothetical protein
MRCATANDDPPPSPLDPRPPHDLPQVRALRRPAQPQPARQRLRRAGLHLQGVPVNGGQMMLGEEFPTLPTREQAEARRDASMESVEANAAPDWKDAARAMIAGLEPGTEFLTEDVRELLDQAGLEVHDLRALGPLVKAQERAGVIEMAGYRAARTSNLSPKVLWRRV